MGNGGGYTDGGYDVYGEGASHAMRDDHDESDLGRDPYGGTA